MSENVGGELLKDAISFLKPSDIIFFAVPLLSTIAILTIAPGKDKKISIKYKWGLSAISLLIFLLGQLSYFKTHASRQMASGDYSLRKMAYMHFISSDMVNSGSYSNVGVLVGTIHTIAKIIKIFNSSHTLTNDEIHRIDSFLKRNSNMNTLSAMPDSINIVYIIVESLNAEVVDMTIGDMTVMPVISNLCKSRGSVSFNNVSPQICDGISSDGQLILLTGLLPLKTMPYALVYGTSREYPSLADFMPEHNKYLLLADDGKFWNQLNVLKNFRLGECKTIKDFPGVKKSGRDAAMMDYASAMLDTIPSPFMMTLITMSMHVPFEEPSLEMPSEIRNHHSLNEMQKKYLTVCNYTDTQIGKFIRKLPKNTIIAIASDHPQNVARFNSNPPAAFFLAANTDSTINSDKRVFQYELFPTLLDLLHIGGKYTGLALSLLNKNSGVGQHSPEEASEISEMIICGDYFRMHQ